MSEHMHAIEIKGHLQKLGLVAQVAMTIPANAVLQEFSHYQAVGPMLDPTGYRDVMDNVSKNERGMRALAAFQKEIKEIWPELEQDTSF